MNRSRFTNHPEVPFRTFRARSPKHHSTSRPSGPKLQEFPWEYMEGKEDVQDLAAFWSVFKIDY